MEDEIVDNDASNQRAVEMKSKKQKQQKKKNVWLKRDIDKLISLVKEDKFVWNTNHAEYNNRLGKKLFWLKVAKDFDMKFNAAEVHAKWIALRKQYINHRKKKMYFKYYNSLVFIDGSRERGSDSSTSESDDDSDEIDTRDNDESDRSVVELASTISADVKLSHSSAIISAAATLPYSPVTISAAATLPHSSTTISPRATNKIFLTHGIPTTPTSVQPSRSFVSRFNNCSNARDNALGTFILSELRSLPESDAHTLRWRLQRALLDFSEEMQNNIYEYEMN
ncbi:uncharacterized protein LOC116806505 [Drosophila grimshawi]|uniref:uncharacterized protein LOC116806505 n=1 Tax=Drosophila grimshawi TaxID=7222 RepID=UPI0013EF3F98|nr:uncharacterized protein LOC116806505 [Drosophila grimshawi]